MKPIFVVACAVLLFTSGVVQAANLLTEQQARAKAIGILKGDPYGRTPAAVAANIKQSRLVADGVANSCGDGHVAAWEFHVVVVTSNKEQFNNGVIDGFLTLDARTGKMLCANLPLID